MFYFQPVIAVMLLSFSSSLPLILVGSTLQAWYTLSGVSLLTIGMLTLVGQPYVYKFLWAPVMDRFAPLRLDHRRGWIVLTQIFLVLGLMTMGLLSPASDPVLLACIALGVAFMSASQDIAVDAYRVDILDDKTRSMGAAVTNFAGRIAILVGGTFALLLAAYIGWQATYFVMAGLIAVGIWVTCRSPSPALSVPSPQSVKAALYESIGQIMRRKYAIALVAFILTYKLCDALAFALNTTFLIRGLGFSLTAIALSYKITSLVALLLGSLVGGVLMRYLGLYRSLLYFGILQATANLSFLALAWVGKSMTMMVSAVFIDYFCSSLATVAFLVFLMSLCDKRYSASQYAFFSALTAVARVFAGPEVALLVDHMGWAFFYFVTFLFGWPALLLLLWLKKRIRFSAQGGVE